MALKVLAINCTLKSEGESSTDLLLSQVMEAFAPHDAQGEVLRAAQFNILPGVTSDEGAGDAWPGIRQKIMGADIVVLGTPIWLGQPSSIAKRVLERMDAFLSETDDEGRMVTYGKVAAVAVVGNEDGAHFCSAAIYQAMNDVGFSLAANAVTYWVGEAMGSKDYKDHDTPPEVTDTATRMMVRNAAHLARLLKAEAYPGDDD